MKKILLIIFILSYQFAFGQNNFVKSYYTNYLSFFYCVLQTSDSGFLAVGVNEVPIIGLILVKTDSLGDTLWTRLFSNPDKMLWPTDVYQTMNGDYLISGYAQYGNNLADAYVIRVTGSGNIVWNKIFDVGDIDGLSSPIETINGDLLMVGGCDGSMGGSGKMFLVKTNSAGDLIFAKTFAGNLTTGGTAIEPTASGDFYIIGGIDTSGLIIKIDSSGNALWVKAYSGFSGSTRNLNTLADSSLILMGEYLGDRICVARTDTMGNVQWSKRFEGHGIALLSIIDSNDGGYIITGQRDDTVNFNPYGFALKLNYLGDTLWCKNYMNVGGISCASLTDDGLIFSGGIYNNATGLVKADANGQTSCGVIEDNWTINSLPLQVLSPTLIADTVNVNVSSLTFTDTGSCTSGILCSSVGIQESFLKNYEVILLPNPTTGKLKVENEGLRIRTIHVYNIFGDEVIDLQQSNEVDLSTLPEGMYIVEISGDDFSWREKILKTNY